MFPKTFMSNLDLFKSFIIGSIVSYDVSADAINIVTLDFVDNLIVNLTIQFG